MEAAPASYKSLDVRGLSNLVHVVNEKTPVEVGDPTMTRPAQAECLLHGAPWLTKMNLADRAIKQDASAVKWWSWQDLWQPA